MICSSVPVEAEISKMPSDMKVATGKERKLDAIRPIAEITPSQKYMINGPGTGSSETAVVIEDHRAVLHGEKLSASPSSGS
ncbi:MAG: hypothetical protein CM1200mP29_04530 [Verrucomicrobiota bacterium]|nr:MAG: hypothetical protein CM1200mP29_04530 [Verrucomicrobiota bacterium]